MQKGPDAMEGGSSPMRLSITRRMFEMLTLAYPCSLCQLRRPTVGSMIRADASVNIKDVVFFHMTTPHPQHDADM